MATTKERRALKNGFMDTNRIDASSYWQGPVDPALTCYLVGYRVFGRDRVLRVNHRVPGSHPARGATHRIPEERWGIVFASVALDILMIAVGPTVIAHVMDWRTLHFLRHEAIDPNAGRKRLHARVVSVGNENEGV